MVYENKFWCKNINDLFCDWRIIPSHKMNIEQQINCLLRFLFIVFIFCLIFNSNNTIFFLIFILFIIIILYMIKGNTMIQQKENFMYTYPEKDKNYQSKNSVSNMPRYKRARVTNNGEIIQDVNYNPFAYDAIELEVNDPNYVSNNYKIVGNPNPKTLVPPVIVPPIADLSYWKANNLITHTAVNDNKNIDVYQSGYEVSNFCGDNQCPKTNNNFDYIKLNSNYKKVQGEEHDFDMNRNNRYHQKYDDHQRKTHQDFNPRYDMHYNEIRENFNIEEYTKSKDRYENIGLVNKRCGYDEDQFKEYGLPVNMTVGDCEKNKDLKQYNKNLFTQIIQPNVYTVNEVNEPINSNIGISYDQQFEPLTYDVNEYGLTFTEHNPLDPNFDERDNILKYNDKEIIEPINTYNVYDPRFTGYGTSYRAYTDNNIGQTRFYYDDINSVRMPNYITRSKIDFADFADTYGPMNNERGNVNNSDIRALANQKFLDDSLTFRTGLQERLMRKTNAEAWQQRKFPISKNSQRMLGNMSMR
jgi:hypothetical protein